MTLNQNPESWPSTTMLPDDLLRAIGSLIVEHSFLESVLTEICYKLAGVDEVVGRIAIREPRVQERFEMVVDLATQRGLVIQPAEIVSMLRRDLPKVTSYRDGLAHSIFVQRPETPEIWVRMLRGQWTPKRPGATKVKRSVEPTAELLRVENIDHVVEIIRKMQEALLIILRALDADQFAGPEARPAPGP